MLRPHKVKTRLRASTNPSIRFVASGACAALVLTATGCSRAPTFNLLGSFFPAWILCGVIGIVLTVAVRIFFMRIDFEKELSPLIVVYPCMAAFFTFTLWLLFFS